MFRPQEKRTLHVILYSKFTLVCFFVILALFAHGVWGVYIKEQETKQKLDSAEAELGSLLSRKEALETEIEHLSTARGIEGELRQKFEVAREGEKVFILLDPPEVEAPAPEKKSGIINWFLELFEQD